MPIAPTPEEMLAADKAFTPPSADEMGKADEIFGKKVAGYTKLAERFSGTMPLGIGEHAAAAEIHPDDRELFASILAKQYETDQSMKKAGYGARLGTSVVQGAIDAAMPIAKLVGAVPKLSPDQERYKQHLIAIRDSIDPTIRPDPNGWMPDSGTIPRALQQTGRMAFPMVNAITAGRATGGMVNPAAAPLLKWGATALGTSGSMLPQTADQTYTALIGEGVHPTRAKMITAVSAPIEAAIESILPDPFEGYGAALRGTARQVAAKLLGHFTANYTKELGEEGLQAVVNETAMEIGRMADANIPDKGVVNILTRGLSEMAQSALPLAIMTSPGAAVGGVQVAQESAARADRLAALKHFRAKGYISAEDGKNAGIEGETRKQRLANADAEIQQLEQEIQNAQPVPQTSTVDASSSPRVEAQVQQGPQPQSSEGIRGSGQESGQVPGQEVQKPNEVLKQPDEHAAALDALAAAEAAIPEPPKVEPPKRDVADKIRSALTEGPVTVSTPKVKNVKIGKVLEDGTVVSKRGVKMGTPDETWTINPPTPAKVEVQPEPKKRGRKPGDLFPEQARGWLEDAISRRPSNRNTPAEIADWISKGFPEGQWRSYTEKSGHASLEESVSAVMGEMRGPEPAKPPVQEQPAAGAEESTVPAPAQLPAKKRGRKDQPVAQPAQGTRRGEVGGKLAAGEVVLTSSGRPTTPFPSFDLSTGRKATTSVRKVDEWLLHNAVEEARSRGDDYNLTIFSGENAKNLPQASKDSMEEYLFGEQPAVPKPITKPLATTPEKPAVEKPSEPSPGLPRGKVVSKEEAKAAETKQEIPSEQGQRTMGSDRPPLSQLGKAGSEAGLVTAEGKTRPIRYVAVEADEIIPSHDARRAFTRNEGGDENERPYHDPKQGAASRNIVVNISKIDPDKISMLLSDTPTPSDGPPITTDTGVVLGGNARSMGMQLAYHNGGEAANRLKQAVVAASGKFGIDAKAVEGMKQPVIVRVLDQPGERGELSALLNESLAASKSQATIAVSQGKRVSEDTASKISAMLEPEGFGDPPTIREVLGNPVQADRIVRALRSDGAWSDREIDLYTDPATGTLNDDGKAAVEKLLLGKLISDPSIVGDASPGVRQKLLSALGPLVRGMSDKTHGTKLTQVVKDAVAAFGGYKAEGLPLERYFMTQKAMFDIPGQGDYAVSGMVHAMDTLGPLKFKRAIDGIVRSLGIKSESGTQTKSLFEQMEETVGTVEEAIQQEIDPPLKFTPAKAVSPPKTKLQHSAEKAVQDAIEETDKFGNQVAKNKYANPFLHPELYAGAGRVVAKWVKAGTLKFAAFIEQLAKQIGQAKVDMLRPALESEWDKAHASGEYPGMEPRTAENQAEPVPMDGDDLTSIKKAIVNEMRELVGLPEMEGSTAQTVEEWVDTAKSTLSADPKAAIRLVNELATNPRPISQHDAMLLQFRYRQLANQLKPVVDEFLAAKQSKDPVAIATARKALSAARKEMTDFEEIIHPSKETWGRTGVALQQMLRKDFSVEAILRRGQEANDGEELSPDQTAELTEKAKKLQELQAQLEQEQKKREALEAELASKRQHEETVNRAKQAKVRKKSDKLVAAEKKVAAAWERFRNVMSVPSSNAAAQIGAAVEVAKAYVELGYTRFSEFMAAVRQNVPDADSKLFRQAWDQANPEPEEKLDPSDRAALSKVAREIQRELVESGMADRDEVIDAVHNALQEELPDLTRRQTMDALSRYGQFQRQSQDQIEKLIRGMNTEILKLSQIDQMEIAMRRVDELREQGKSDEEIGKALQDEHLLVEATGLVRDRPSQTVRQLTQKYNELKKSIPATPEGKAGLLQTALGQIERALKNRISDLKFEIARGEKVVKEKKDRPTNDTIKSLEAERDALVKIHKEMFPPKKPSEAQRIAAAIRGAEKAIEAIEKQLATRDFDRVKNTPLSSPELDATRARLEQLKAARKAVLAMEKERMEGEGGRTQLQTSSEEKRRKAYEALLRTRIADYQQILAEGDFAPKEKKGPRVLGPSEMKLKREMEDVRHEVLQKYADYHLAHLTGIEWAADKLAETTRLSRALLTFVDLPLLRQGAVVTYGRPTLAKNAMRDTFMEIAKTFGGMKIDSRQAEFEMMHKLTEGPAGEFRQRAGLELPTSDEKITKQEEAFQGRWAKYFPGVSLGGRLYTMIMNKLRADLFDLMVENIGRDGQVTIDEGKLIAHFVNVATGRSDLKGVPFVQVLEQQSHLMNELFFATRWVASRFQYLAMPFYLPFRGGLKNNWRVKKAVYKEMGRQLTGTGLLLGTIALAAQMFWDDDDKDKPTIELDPTSSDFLKVRIGETRIDLLAGFSQIFVLGSRLALQRTKSSVTGKVRKFGEGFEPPTTLSTILQFGRTKLAPVPGTLVTIANDWTNVVGGKETPLSLATSLFTSISLRDVYTSMQVQGVTKGAALALLGELGASTNTYGPRTQFVTGNAEERQEQIKDDLKNMHWDSPEQPPYSEFLTDEQLKQFADRRREKRGLAIFNATYSGKDEDELKTRDRNLEHVMGMKAEGVSLEDAIQLLREYHRRPDEHGKRHALGEGYFKRLRALRSIYSK